MPRGQPGGSEGRERVVWESYKGKEARKSLSCLGEGPSGVGGGCER